jgi:hypothetical protein
MMTHGRDSIRSKWRRMLPDTRRGDALERIGSEVAELGVRVGRSESTTARELASMADTITELRGSADAAEAVEHASVVERYERLIAVVGELRDRVAAIERQVAGNRLRALADQVARSAALAAPTLGDLGLSPGRRARHAFAPGSSRAVCSLAVGSHLDLLAVSGMSFVEYGRRWGWDVILSAEDLAGGRPAPWGKVTLIRELLDDYELVLWLDADAVFVDAQADLAQVVVEGKDLYLVEHRWGEPVNAMPNTGVLLIRSTPWSRSFVERWSSYDHLASQPWTDNAALVELIGYQLEPVRLVRPNEDLERVGFLPLAWNSVAASESPRPYVKHYAGQGLSVQDLRECLLDDLATLRRGVLGSTALGARPGPSVRGGPPLRGLSELPRLLTELGLLGCGLVLGLDGARAEQLLTGWPGLTLISVDPRPADGTGIRSDEAGDTTGSRRWAEARLAKFGTRSEIWSMTGRQAAVRLPAGSLDFVVIDARSVDRPAKEELELWWGKLRPGGVLVGTQYVDEELHGGAFGMRGAVDAFSLARDLTVSVGADDEPPSWLVGRSPA